MTRRHIPHRKSLGIDAQQPVEELKLDVGPTFQSVISGPPEGVDPDEHREKACPTYFFNGLLTGKRKLLGQFVCDCQVDGFDSRFELGRHDAVRKFRHIPPTEQIEVVRFQDRLHEILILPFRGLRRDKPVVITLDGMNDRPGGLQRRKNVQHSLRPRISSKPHTTVGLPRIGLFVERRAGLGGQVTCAFDRQPELGDDAAHVLDQEIRHRRSMMRRAERRKRRDLPVKAFVP